MGVLEISLIVIIFVLVAGIGVAVNMNTQVEKRRRNMAVIAGNAKAFKSKKSDADDQNKRRAEIAKKLKDTKGEEDGEKKKQTLTLSLQQAGLNKTSPAQFWIYSFILMFVAVGAAFMMKQSFLMIGLIGITALLGIPRLILKNMAGKRQKKFLLEFADALEAVVRLLKAGMPVAEAVAMISKEYSGPVGEEMSIIYDKQKIGVSLHEAAYEATHRMPLPEMQMFATGLAIQAQTGSSLSEVLENLARVIRQRFRLKRKVKALASEAVASASIIGALPNLLAIGMWFANREYINTLFTDPFGQVLLGAAVFWMCCGVVVMKIMINFKV